MYEYGLGVPKDEAKAVCWYEKAIEQHDNADARAALFRLRAYSGSC